MKAALLWLLLLEQEGQVWCSSKAAVAGPCALCCISTCNDWLVWMLVDACLVDVTCSDWWSKRFLRLFAGSDHGRP